MATGNITISDLNIRILHAAEMATEIKEENSRQYALASSLVDRIEAGTTAHGLAEVLEDRLSETGQMLRLVECLENLKNELCRE